MPRAGHVGIHGELGWSAGCLAPCQAALQGSGPPPHLRCSPGQPLGVLLPQPDRSSPLPLRGLSRAPYRVLSPFSVSDLPQGAETFRVSGSSGLEVFVVYDPARVTAPTDKTHWPLDANVDVTVSVDTASKDLNDLKVRGCFPTEWGFISHPTPVQGKRPPKCSPIHILPPLNRTPQGLGHLHLHNTSW